MACLLSVHSEYLLDEEGSYVDLWNQVFGGWRTLLTYVKKMHRVVEYTGLRWLHVDPHWIGEALSGSRCLPNLSQVGLFHSFCQYQGPISMGHQAVDVSRNCQVQGGA